MKHLLTAIACCLAVAGGAQTPYNPDSNGDNVIAMDDFLDFLPLFGGEFFVQDSIVYEYYSDPNPTNYYDVTYVLIDEEVDVFVIENINRTHFFILPAGESYRTINILTEWCCPSQNISMQVRRSNEGSDTTGGMTIGSWGYVSNDLANTYIRLPDGRWFGDH